MSGRSGYAVEVRRSSDGMRASAQQRYENALANPKSRLPRTEKSLKAASPIAPVAADSTQKRLQTPDTDDLQEKLKGLMAVREQIEALANRHKKEEEELSAAIQRHFHQSRKNTQAVEEQHSAVASALAERDQALSMLETFREEAGAVVRRLHASLKATSQQCEEHLRSMSSLSSENAMLRQRQRELAETQPPAEAPREDSDMKRRMQEYVVLLNEADALVQSLREENETLRRKNSADSPTSPSSDISSLRDQLRKEKRQRLEAEEQSHAMVQEQQRRIQLLEARLEQAMNQGHGTSTSEGDTPVATTPSDRVFSRSTPRGVVSRRRAVTPVQPPAPTLPNDSQVVSDGNSTDAQSEHKQELLEIEKQLALMQQALGTPR